MEMKNHDLSCLNSSLGQFLLIVRVEKCASGRVSEEKMPNFWSVPALHTIITSIHYENFTLVVMT